MRWFYRSVLYCKLLLTCKGFLSPSRFSLLTGTHWTDTQVVQSQNKSYFMMLKRTVSLALLAGSSNISGMVIHAALPPNEQSWAKPVTTKTLWLSKPHSSGEALGGGALHWEIGIPLPYAPFFPIIRLHTSWELSHCWEGLLPLSSSELQELGAWTPSFKKSNIRKWTPFSADDFSLPPFFFY